METSELKTYISQKIKELDKNYEEQELIRTGRLSFGMVQQHYQHLPSWQKFVKGKKRVIRLIWINAFVTVLLTGGFFYNWEQPDTNWLKAIVILIATSAVITLFFGVFNFFTVAHEVNKVQREARRLIYEDLLDQIEKMEKKKETV